MKPTINKSRLMKEAHILKKRDGYEMSIALKLAWMEEKKRFKAEMEAWLWSIPSPDYVAPSAEELKASEANFNISYYKEYEYTGD